MINMSINEAAAWGKWKAKEYIKLLFLFIGPLYRTTLRPRLQRPCLKHCLFKGSYSGLLLVPPLPTGWRDHRAKRMDIRTGSPYDLFQNIL